MKQKQLERAREIEKDLRLAEAINNKEWIIQLKSKLEILKEFKEGLK